MPREYYNYTRNQPKNQPFIMLRANPTIENYSVGAPIIVNPDDMWEKYEDSPECSTCPKKRCSDPSPAEQQAWAGVL